MATAARTDVHRQKQLDSNRPVRQDVLAARMRAVVGAQRALAEAIAQPDHRVVVRQAVVATDTKVSAACVG